MGASTHAGVTRTLVRADEPLACLLVVRLPLALLGRSLLSTVWERLMQSRYHEMMKFHLRQQIDGATTLARIEYLTYCLASGFEGTVTDDTLRIPLDELRLRSITAALASYHKQLDRVLPSLKPMEATEALAPAIEGRDWSSVDRLEVANRLRHILLDAMGHDDGQSPPGQDRLLTHGQSVTRTTVQDGELVVEEITDEDFMA